MLQQKHTTNKKKNRSCFPGFAMWFKNLQIYRLPAPWAMTSEQLEARLAPQIFAPCSSLEMQTQGWISPRDLGVDRSGHRLAGSRCCERFKSRRSVEAADQGD